MTIGSRSARGALRDRHERWARDAMDAITLPDVRCDGGRPSRVVLIPRRWDQARGPVHERRWLTSPEHRGEHEAAVKTIAQGRPGRSGQTCGEFARVVFSFPREAAGAASARSSLRPLISGGTSTAKLGQNVPRERVFALGRHCEERSDEAIHVSAAARWIASLRSSQ